MLDSNLLQPILLSLKVAITATFFTLIVGVALARWLSRNDFSGKTLLEVLIVLPMVLPPSVVGYGLLLLFGNQGPLGHLLEKLFGVHVVFTLSAAIIASTLVALPLMFQNAKGAFQNIDHTFERAARTLGASEGRLFWTVTLPLAWPGIMSGLVLSFARALGEFGATLMVAGNIPGRTQTIPLALYFAVDSGDAFTANVLMAVVTTFSFTLIFALNLWLKGKNPHERSKVL